MKAYINKGTKIKWENSPSAPEFTNDGIVNVVKNDVGIMDLKDVRSGALSQNSILIYEPGPAKFVPRTYPAYNWAKLDPINIGGARTKRIDLTNNGTWKVLAVFTNVTLEAGATAGDFGAVFGFTDDTRRAMGEVPNAIKTNGVNNLNIEFGSKYPEGLATSGGSTRLFSGLITDGASSVSTCPGERRRIDGYYMTKETISYIEYRSQTSDAIIPDNSTAEIYILRYF